MDNILLYSIVIFFLATFVFLFIEKPKKFILIFIGISPIINLFWNVRAFGLSIIELFSSVFPILFIVIYFARNKSINWVHGKFEKIFLLVLLAFLIPSLKSMFSGLSLIIALKNFIKVFCGFASYQLFLNLFHVKERYRLNKAILFAVIFTLILVVYQLASGQGFANYNMNSNISLKGYYHDPGQNSRLALIGILLILPQLRSFSMKTSYLLNYLILGLCVLTLGFSISRNVIVTVIIIMIVYTMLSRKIVTMAIIVSIGVAFYFMAPMSRQLIERKINKEIRYFSGENVRIETLGSGRVGIWQRTIDEFTESSLFEKLTGTGYDIGPHGEYLGLIRFCGVFGFLAVYSFYFLLLIKTFKIIMKDRKNQLAFNCFLMVLTVFVMSVGSAPVTDFYFQIILFAFIAFFEMELKQGKLDYIRTRKENWIASK